MSEIIDINDKRVEVIHGDDFNEDVCEHCLGGIFKSGASQGNCQIGPPATGVILVPRQNPLTQQVEPMLQPWSQFPIVERRHFCMAWEPRDAATEH